jgi:general nucleoside transport system permease protein
MNEKIKVLIKPAMAILISLILGALILLLAGYDVGTSFLALWDASFRNLRAFTGMLNKSSPLLFTGLAVAISFRGNVFNIGAEGQLLMGATVAAVTGITFTNLPGPILILLMILSGAIGGALWAYIPGLLKAKYDVSEVITTIMFNYIALQFIGYLVRGPMRDIGQAEPISFAIARQGFLPSLIPGTQLHIGFILGVAISVVLFLLLFKTFIGYEIRAVGLNKNSARVAGINVQGTIIGTMLLSGAIAGIGGAIELANVHYLLEGISPGYGYTAIAVAILASSNPLGVIFSSLLFGALSAGATSMQRAAGVSASFVQIFQGVIIVAIALAAVQKKGKKEKRA